MNYYGSVEKKTVAPEEIYAFLRKALSAAKPDLVPLRGPTRYVEGEWEYDNVLAGPLTRFEGRETIRRAGTLVYASTYHGGAIE